MSYKAFVAIKEHVELEYIKTLSPKQVNEIMHQFSDRIDELKAVGSALREYIDAIPKEIQFTCSMPGVDREWVDEIIDNINLT